MLHPLDWWEALRLSEERYRLLAENMLDIVIITNARGECTYVSPSIERVLGYTANERIGKIAWDIIHPDDMERLTSAMNSARTTGDYGRCEYRAHSKAEQYIWLESIIKMVYDAQGNLSQGIAISRDISERKRAEIALQQGEERLRLVTDNMQDLLCLTDLSMTIQYASPSHYALLGYEPDSLIGKKVSEYIHPDDLEMATNRAVNAMVEQKPERGEVRYKGADGNYVWLEITGKTIYDDSGQVIGAIFNSRDITERKRGEEALRERERLEIALQKEQELSQLKSKMMARISHEFRTPLATIRLSTELLERYTEPMISDKHKEQFQTIKLQIGHITDLLDDIGIVLKGAANFVDFRPTTFELAGLCQAVIDEMLARSPERRFLVDIDHTLQSIVGDRRLIHRMLSNLLSNAVKFSPDEKPIYLDAVMEDALIVLRVRDEGRGISDQDQYRIFEPFFRGDYEGEISGLGLGLAIVKRLADFYGGTLSLESRLGEGSTFIVRLPLLELDKVLQGVRPPAD